MTQLLIPILTLLTQVSFSQQNQMLYFDHNYLLVDADERYSYSGELIGTRVLAYDDKDTLRMDGHYDSKRRRHGKFIHYHNNGHLSSEGEYHKGILKGYWRNYFYDGHLDNDGKYYKDKKIGVWKYYYKNGETSCIEEYSKNGKQSMRCWNSDGTESFEPKSWNVRAQLPFSRDSLELFITENINYPKKAIQSKTEGKVLIYYVVETDGTLSRFKVKESVSPEIDAEALRVAKLLPNHIPAKYYNRQSKTLYTLPINFQLINK